MSYFISPVDNTAPQILVDTLVALLHSKWPQVEIEPINNPNSNHLLQWKLSLNSRLLIGTLDKTQQVIHLSGDIRDCAHFAHWYRTQMDEAYPLAFYDEGFSADVLLSADTTEQQITGPFLHS